MKLNRPNDLTRDELQAVLRKPENKIVCWHCNKHPATDVHHIDGNHGNNAPLNLIPWCKRCHNDHHGISDNLTVLGLVVRQYVSIQQQRIAMGNRIFAYENLGYEATVAQTILGQLKDLEQSVGKQVAKMLKVEPIYSGYLSKILGVGPAIAAELITLIADPGRFGTISSLWAYGGLDVRNGSARKRKRGEKANWNARLRMVAVGRLVPQFIKLKNHGGCFGRHLYDQYKQFYTERDGNSLTKLHIENRTRRKVAKVFLSCLWVAWRKVKGLPVSEPYAMEKLDHTHLVTPEDWAGAEWSEGVQLKFE